ARRRQPHVGPLRPLLSADDQHRTALAAAGDEATGVGGAQVPWRAGEDDVEGVEEGGGDRGPERTFGWSSVSGLPPRAGHQNEALEGHAELGRRNQAERAETGGRAPRPDRRGLGDEGQRERRRAGDG